MRAILVTVALASLAPALARADETGAFVVRLGDDTLSVERITRTPTELRGEYVIRSPRTSRRSYRAELSPEGTIRRFELLTRNLGAGASAAEMRSTLEFRGDSATSTVPRGDSTVTRTVATPMGAVPSLQAVMGLNEQLVRQARAAGAPRYSTGLVAPGASQITPCTLTPAGGDTLHLGIETQVGNFGPWILVADREGRLLHYEGPGTPFQAVADRVGTVDLDALAASFADRPLGALSARDTARATLGGAELWVDYGRPARRGREIFGVVVPWNTVWRTGANAATQFHTPVALTVGGAEVPAGTYTLWTLPSSNGWKLVLNRQTGQWGTVHDPAQDLVRVDMEVERLAEPVELLTISIEPEGDAAALHVRWDHAHASVPIALRR